MQHTDDNTTTREFVRTAQADASPLTWSCVVCSEVHPVDHEGMFCGLCQAMVACVRCERAFKGQCCELRGLVEGDLHYGALLETQPPGAEDAAAAAFEAKLARELAFDVRFVDGKWCWYCKRCKVDGLSFSHGASDDFEEFACSMQSHAHEVHVALVTELAQ